MNTMKPLHLKIKDTSKKLKFTPRDNEGNVGGEWHAKFKDYNIIIKDDNGVYRFYHDPTTLREEDNDCIKFFVEQIDEINEQNQVSKIDGVEDTLEDEDELDEQGEEKNPYNPEEIRVDTKNFSIAQIFEMITVDNEIDLSPDFQRNFVWSDNKRKSRLIESILLRIPLPVFYFSQLDDGKMQVIDGVQRLTVLEEFLSGKFKLGKLEYLTKLNGKYYPSESRKNNKKEDILDAKFVRRIKQTQLTINIIDPGSPSKVKYDIFKRVNSGGKHLNSQEIRNCMAKPKARKFIRELAHSKYFKEATYNSVNDIRMAAQKLVMRFIGFHYLKVRKHNDFKYSSDIEDFLNKTLDVFNSSSSGEKDEIREGFENAMINAQYLFGDFAFRKILSIDSTHRRPLINKSLFTTWSVFLSKYSHANIKKDFSQNALAKPLAEELSKRKDYYDAVSLGTNSKNKLDCAFDMAKKIFETGKKSCLT